MKYRKKAEIVEATQWVKVGDTPEVSQVVVASPHKLCSGCKLPWKQHGRLQASKSERYIICPGDWIITCGKSTFDVYSNNKFKSEYEPIEESATSSSIAK